MGQGLRQRPRDHGARRLHAAAAGRDARRVRPRRDERRGHGRPPRALSGRPGGAALVDRDAAARVRAGPARPSHASGRHQRARRDARRRAAGGGVLRRRGGLDPLHPARLHARQAGRDGGAGEPGAEARGARQARPRRVGRHGGRGIPPHDRGDQPRGRVRQCAHGGRAALRRPGPRAARRRAPARAAARRAAHAARGGLERALEGARGRHLAAGARVRVLARRPGADRRRRGVPRPSRAHQARAPVGAVRPGRGRRRRAGGADPRPRRGASARTTARMSSATATSPRSPPTRTRAWC